jgi:polyphosphate kinase
MLASQAACYQSLLPRLSRHGIVIATWAQLTPAQRDEASAYVDSNVSPALTPLGFDPAHPFPFMSNLSTNWGFVMRGDDSMGSRIVRVKIPNELPAWVVLQVDVPAGHPSGGGRDARTLAIKMAVYRVGDDTPFVRALVRTAEAGKQVACVIELTARFDEARNLHWAQQLENVGAHVTYGVAGLKTHTKIAPVVQ